MSSRFRRGLVVGKFAPLHRGHELVIERALLACDEVIVLSYSKPELPGCPPQERARWLAALFPSARTIVLTDALLAEGPGPRELPANDAPDDAQRRFVARVLRERLRCTVDAVFASEDYGAGFARVLTECFQAADPAAPDVAYVPVDPARALVPVSGTIVRGDVHAHRRWLSPAVYASFVQRVCLLGGESTGKTTLAAALADACGSAWVPEYGRTLWEEKSGGLVPEDMPCIGRRQVELEDAAAGRAARWLFCDTSPLTTLFYSHALFGGADPVLEELARRPYAFNVVCAPDLPFVQDGTRQDPAFRDRQHAWYLEQLGRSGAPFAVVGGDLTARVEQVRSLLAALPR